MPPAEKIEGWIRKRGENGKLEGVLGNPRVGDGDDDVALSTWISDTCLFGGGVGPGFRMLL